MPREGETQETKQGNEEIDTGSKWGELIYTEQMSQAHLRWGCGYLKGQEELACLTSGEMFRAEHRKVRTSPKVKSEEQELGQCGWYVLSRAG
jgi:hypothetical protein